MNREDRHLLRDSFPQDVLLSRFTDRTAIVDTFRRVVDGSIRIPVIGLYGVGGAGKSTLLHFLRHILASVPTPTPLAFISFQAGRTPTTAPEALWNIRSQISKWGDLTFPRFDLLWGTWWERTYHTPVNRNPSLLSEDAATIADVLEGIGLVPVVGNAAKLLNLALKTTATTRRRLGERRVREWLGDNFEAPAGAKDWQQVLKSAELAHIHHLMPCALAADLGDSRVGRLVIMVDTYERLEDQTSERNGRIEKTFVERLARELADVGSQATLIIAGRNRLRWPERRSSLGTWVLDPASFWAQDTEINEAGVFIGRHLCQYAVDIFSAADSRTYLVERRGLPRAAAESIYKISGGLPLALAAASDLFAESDDPLAEIGALQASIANAAPLSAEWSRAFGSWLLDRLLEQLTEHGRHELVGLLRAACIPRWFDGDLLYDIAQGGPSFQEYFDQLTRYGFVEYRNLEGVEAYSIHPVVRREMLRSSRIARQQTEWHERALAFFTRTHGDFDNESDRDFAFRLEALYHRTIVRNDTGLTEVWQTFDELLGAFRLTRAQAVIEVVRDLGDRLDRSDVEVLVFSGRLAMAAGDYDMAIVRLRSATSLLEGVWDHELARKALGYLGEAYRLHADYEHALGAFRALEEIAERSGDRRSEFVASWGMSLTYKLLDDYPAALNHCLRAEDLARTVEEPELLDTHTFGVLAARSDPANIGRHKSELLRQMGDYVGAAAACAMFKQLYSAYPNTLGFRYSQLCESHLLRMEGHDTTATELAADCLIGFERAQNRRGELSAVRLLGQLLCLSSRLAEAREQFERLLATSRGSYPYGAIYAHLGLGEAKRRAGAPEAARDHYQTVVDACRTLGFRVECAYGNLGLSETCRALGDSDGAIEHAREAARAVADVTHPWTMTFAHLAEAASVGDWREPLGKALATEETIERRDSDKRIDLQMIRRVEEAREQRILVPPLAFNFL
jgi:tetratricopeptide (TPR) repeat protein